jgi:hypothetical protein
VTDSVGPLTLLRHNYSAEGENVSCKRLSGANAFEIILIQEQRGWN